MSGRPVENNVGTLKSQPTAPTAGTVAWVQRLKFNIPLLGIGGFLLLLVAFFSVTTPFFLSYSNLMNILASTAVIGIITLGQAFVIIQGGFDLSVAGTVPLGAIAYTLLVNAGWDVPVALLVSVLLGAAVGLINALIITKIGIDALVTTLGTLSITRALAFIISSGVAISFTDVSAAFLSRKTVGGVPYYVWTFLLLAVISSQILRRTTFGRMVYAVGGNREASRLSGIDVDRIGIIVHMICGGMAAFGGVVIACQLLLGSPTVGTDAALTSIAAVILGGASLRGGVGGIPGTVLGVFVMGTLTNGMALMRVPAFYQQMATGVMLLLAVGFGRLRLLTKPSGS